MIIKKLKEEAVVCAVSGVRRLFSIELYNNHARESHPTMQRRFLFEFDWLYMRIGAGHYEMNLMKSFFELNWIPILENLCQVIGFEIEASGDFAKSCKDNHKTWRLLLTFHLGPLQELVLPYVRHCLQTDEIPSAKAFFKYSTDRYISSNNPNFTYLMDQTCRFSQGIVNFRMATRRNNAALLKSAKYMTKELFHGRTHPKYQTIEIYDTLQDLMMPDEVQELNDKFSSITTSGNKSLGEDLDFVLEEKNKQLKSWIPKGVPTDEIWLTVCRNNELLENIKDHCMSMFGIKSEKSSLRPLGIDDAVTAYRVLLRRSKYLERKGDHTSLSGIALDEDLVNFSGQSIEKRIHLLKTEFFGLPIHIEDTKSRHPVPITPAERQKFQSTGSMTNKELQHEIKKTSRQDR